MKSKLKSIFLLETRSQNINYSDKQLYTTDESRMDQEREKGKHFF